MTAPTPEQFLAETGTDEDDFEEQTFTGVLVDTGDPLESIAGSLRQLVALTEARDTDAHGEELRLLGEAYDDLEAKYRSLFDLLAEVEKLVKPSTSKLANSVRDAITAWRNPEIPDEAPAEAPSADPEPVPPAVVNPAVQCTACGRYFADADLLGRHECTASVAQPPAADASLEEWREYARTCGVPLEEPDGIDSMNRSQIRTLLGLPHFEG